jgi:plasmid stabilization system protein ParE
VPRRVAWSFAARQDLLSAIQHLVDQDAGRRAERLLDEVETAGESLADFPDRGRSVPELGPPRRELIVEGYRLVYQVRADELQVLRLIHGKQDFRATWLSPPR